MAECPACAAHADDGARFCASCGTRLPRAAGPAERQQRKAVTALFTDIVGSTALAAGLDPEALRALMSRYYEVMRAEVERHGGRVDKFIGDAVVAFFGVPVSHEDDALRAVRAAAGMRTALDELNGELARRFGVRLQIRTGVNTGDVLTSDASDGDSFTVGDAVNVAARLEQHAAPGEILLGDTTHALVRHGAHAEPIAPLAVKGKDAPLSAFRLVEVADHAPSIPRRLDSPLVGRDADLERARAAFEAVTRDRRGHVVRILGAAGAGKSRLVAEVIGAVERRATVWYGRCLSYGEGITFWPLVEIVRGAAGIIDGDAADDVTRKIAKVVDGDGDAGLIAERLAGVIGAGPGSAAADEISWAVRKLFESSARRRPLLVVFDDVHWAEPMLLDLIDHLLERARDAPILIVCSARPEVLDRRPGWAESGRGATTVRLDPLTHEDSATLIDNLLGGAALQPGLRDRITAAAEGIPLFVEEMLGMLIDSGRLRRSGDGWRIDGDLDDVAVPPTIRALLAARLDALPAAERRVVEAASVVGREFRRDEVAAIVPEEVRAGVGSVLAELVRKDLVVADRSVVRGEGGFRFRHILIRDGAYEAIPKLDRAAIHEQFAAWLETAYAGRTAEVEEILAYHLQEAHRNRAVLGPADDATVALAGRAAGHLLAAGSRALDRNDVHGAVNLLGRAYELSPNRGADLLLAYGSALAHNGSLAEALDILGAAIETANRARDERLAWHARIEEVGWRAQVDTGAGVSAEILAMAPAAVPRFERLGDDVGAARAWLSIATAHLVLGDHGDGLDAAERALRHAERAGHDGLVLDAYRRIGVAVIWGPLPLLDAERRYGDLIDRIGGGPLRKVAATELVAALKTNLGDIAGGRALIAEVRRLYDELGDRLMGAKAALIEHRAPLVEGDYAAAEAILAEACATLAAAGEQSWLSTSMAVWASTLYALDRFDEAYDATVTSERAGSADDVVTQAYWRAERAKVLARRGSEHAADELAAEAVRLIERTDGVLEQAEVYTAVGEMHRVLGRPDEARLALSEALARYEAKGAVPFARQARERLAAVEVG